MEIVVLHRSLSLLRLLAILHLVRFHQMGLAVGRRVILVKDLKTAPAALNMATGMQNCSKLLENH
jgi:hypothetical protein